MITADSSGAPMVDLVLGERKQEEKKPEIYKWPSPFNRGTVEALAWCMLGPYLDKTRLIHRDIRAMHALLCSVIYFLDLGNSENDCSLDGIRNSVKGTRPESGDEDETAYESWLNYTNRILPGSCIDAEVYYGSFRQLDSEKRTPGLLMDALEQFAKVATLQAKIVENADAGALANA